MRDVLLVVFNNCLAEVIEITVGLNIRHIAQFIQDRDRLFELSGRPHRVAVLQCRGSRQVVLPRLLKHDTDKGIAKNGLIDIIPLRRTGVVRDISNRERRRGGEQLLGRGFFRYSFLRRASYD